MGRVDLEKARIHLDELIDQVEAGESIEITRHGNAIARLTPTAKPHNRIDVTPLRSLTETMPLQSQSAADLVRSMRDSDRY